MDKGDARDTARMARELAAALELYASGRFGPNEQRALLEGATRLAFKLPGAVTRLKQKS